MKTICVFCGKSHKGKKPKLCSAKGEVIKGHCVNIEFWKVLHAVENGAIDLDGEAMRLLEKRKKAL